MEDKAKIERCKYSHPHFKNNSIEYHCVVDGWEDDKVRICKKGECESCQKFKSKYVEYPITVHEIENKPIDTSGLGHEEGSLVAIRPYSYQSLKKSFTVAKAGGKQFDQWMNFPKYQTKILIIHGM